MPDLDHAALEAAARKKGIWDMVVPAETLLALLEERKRLVAERDEAGAGWREAFRIAASHQDRATAAEAERDRMKAALAGLLENCGPHARLFLVTRERMNPAGVELFDLAVKHARAALAGEKESTNEGA